MFSVIVPVFNGVDYVDNFVEKMKLQSFRDFEVIFVDDGSVDGTVEALDKKLVNCGFSNIIIKKPNGGVASARNAGLKEAKGEYISFCDFDDNYHPDFLKEVSRFVADNDFVATNFQTIRSEGVVYEKSFDQTLMTTGYGLLKEYMCSNAKFGSWSIAVKKSFLQQNLIEFPQGYSHYEDVYFIIKCMISAKTAVYIDAPLYNYVFQKNSATSKFNEKRIKAFDLIERLEKDFNCAISEGAFARKFLKIKYIWTLTWQCAVYSDKKEYKQFAKQLKCKSAFLKLMSFPSLKIKLSSLIGIFSLAMFRKIAIAKGGKKVNSNA